MNEKITKEVAYQGDDQGGYNMRSRMIAPPKKNVVPTKQPATPAKKLTIPPKKMAATPK